MFRLDFTAWALRRRRHNAVDRFDGTWYRRTLVLGGQVMELRVRQPGRSDSGPLSVELWGRGIEPDEAAEAEARLLLRRVLGLDLDLTGFYRLAERDPRLTELAARFEGMRPPRFPTVFEALVNAIACQQLSLVVGIHLLNRLSDRYGPADPEGHPAADPEGHPPAGPESHPPAGFPTPERVAGAEVVALRPLGFSQAKARAIVALAQQVVSGALDLEALEQAGDDQARAVLLGLEGIGRWSAEYTLLRGLGRLQVLPGDDAGARNNLRKRLGLDPSAGYRELADLARAWWPYGGLVYFHLLLDGLAERGQVLGRDDAAPSEGRAIPGRSGRRRT